MRPLVPPRALRPAGSPGSIPMHSRSARRGARRRRARVLARGRVGARCCWSTGGPRPSASGRATSRRWPTRASTSSFRTCAASAVGAGARRLLRPRRPRARPGRAATGVWASSAAVRRRRRPGRRGHHDLGLRFEGLVVRQVLFNSILPLLPAEYEAAGTAGEPSAEMRAAGDYFVRQGRDADALAAELRTPEKRRRYIASSTGPGSGRRRGLHARGRRFMTEPFGDAEQAARRLGQLRERAGATPLSGAAAVHRAHRADARALRARRPRHVARLPRALRGRLHAT